MPFNLFWILVWLILTPAVMSVVYRMESKR
jgi:hypothetical protein